MEGRRARIPRQGRTDGSGTQEERHKSSSCAMRSRDTKAKQASPGFPSILIIDTIQNITHTTEGLCVRLYNVPLPLDTHTRTHAFTFCPPPLHIILSALPPPPHAVPRRGNQRSVSVFSLSWGEASTSTRSSNTARATAGDPGADLLVTRDTSGGVRGESRLRARRSSSAWGCDAPTWPVRSHVHTTHSRGRLPSCERSDIGRHATAETRGYLDGAERPR